MDETEYDEMDLKIINFIKIINNKENEKIPEPKYFTISTQSAMCNIDNINNIDLSKIVVNISKNIIKNIILKENTDYLIRGIVVDNIIIRYDESYLKKYKKPYIKYLGNIIDTNNTNECLSILNDIHILENNSLKKHGRQKKKKDNEYFYNSCSIIVKASLDIKCVNIKLFNNGRITLTGSKNESDGYYASCVLLDELKKDINIFPDLKQNINLDNNTEIFEENLKKNIIFNNLKIVNYKITMINSDFNTNFKIDLIKLLNILNNSESELFTKFNPEKYRGLIIGYYWNTNKKVQDGRCYCKSKCNGKGSGTGDGQCKKITISIFKSGSVIITGGRLVKQIEDAYKSINNIFTKYYHEIIKLSILDYIDNEIDDDIEDDIVNSIEDNIEDQQIKKIEYKNNDNIIIPKKTIKVKIKKMNETI